MLSDASGAEAASSSAAVSWVLAVAKVRGASVACAGAAENNRPEARAVESRAPVTRGGMFFLVLCRKCIGRGFWCRECGSQRRIPRPDVYSNEYV